jgi:hypothetical protein
VLLLLKPLQVLRGFCRRQQLQMGKRLSFDPLVVTGLEMYRKLGLLDRVFEAATQAADRRR